LLQRDAAQQLVTLFEQPEAADCMFECLTAAGQGVPADRQQLVNLLSEQHAKLRTMPIEELRRLAAEAAAVAAEAGVVAGTVVATEQPEEEVHRLCDEAQLLISQTARQGLKIADTEQVCCVRLSSAACVCHGRGESWLRLQHTSI
jgi:hypothetical protein